MKSRPRQPRQPHLSSSELRSSRSSIMIKEIVKEMINAVSDIRIKIRYLKPKQPHHRSKNFCVALPLLLRPRLLALQAALLPQRLQLAVLVLQGAQHHAELCSHGKGGRGRKVNTWVFFF